MLKSHPEEDGMTDPGPVGPGSPSRRGQLPEPRRPKRRGGRLGRSRAEDL